MARRTADREFIIEFLNLYRQYPALWKIKSKEYSDRNLKNEAYKALIEKYKEIDMKADKDTVKRKINSLRTNYRKELRKAKAFYGAGGSSDDVFVSSLWYFKELNFLQDQETPMEEYSKTISLKNEEQDNDERNLLEEQNADMDVIPIPKERPITPKQRPKPTTTETGTRRKTAASQTRSQEKIHVAYADLNGSDEYENIAITWANDLKKMSAEQQIHAKKAISDILYEGQLGTLHRYSVTINANTVPFGTSRFQQATSLLETTSPLPSSASTSMSSPQQ